MSEDDQDKCTTSPAAEQTVAHELQTARLRIASLEQELERAGKEIESYKHKHYAALEQISKLEGRNGQLDAACPPEEESLAISRKLFENFMNNSPAVAFMKDRNGRYLYVNRRFCDVFKTTQADMTGITDEDYLPGEICEHLRDNDRRVIEGGQPIEVMETVPTPDGQSHQWLVLKFPVEDTHGRTHVGGVAVDISTPKRLEAELSKIEIMKQREDFMATLTHDLKNPLIGSQRALELFLNGYLGDVTDEQLKIIAQMQKSTVGLLSMIDDLLGIYRYEKDAGEITFSPVDMAHVIADCIQDLSSFALSKSIDLDYQLPASAPVQGHGPSLYRVIQNLLINAIKFTPDFGKITVSLGHAEEGILIEIRDTGCGISPEDIGRLFDRFWQRSAARRYGPGVGLGLYLAKLIVDTHHGKIFCKSTVGTGSSFFVFLPKTQRINNAAPAAGDIVEPGRTHPT